MNIASRQFQDLETPCVIVDHSKLCQNITQMQELAKKNGVRLRPHIKTHKSLYIAQMQIAAGATGVTAAKIDEAETMACGGIADIFIDFPIIGSEKIKRLFSLNKFVNLTVAVDSLRAAEALSSGFKGSRLNIYIEVETGLERCGIPYNDEGIRLLRRISSLPNIAITGLCTIAGTESLKSDNEEGVLLELKRIAEREATILRRMAKALKEVNITAGETCVGSTATSRYYSREDGITQIKPGAYVFNDALMIERRWATIDECAATVLSTVVSKPEEHRVVIDAGAKSIGTGKARSGVDRWAYGIVRDYPDVTVERLYEEHGVLHVKNDELEIGDKIEIIPKHVCPVFNLFDSFLLEKDGSFLKLPIDARGKSK